MTDSTDRPPSDDPNAYAPPPRRSAPNQLRVRIQTELDRSSRHSRRPRVIIALVAAATVAVLGAVGFSQFGTVRDAVPMTSPSPAKPTDPPTPADQQTPAPTTPTPEPTPVTESTRSMTESEIAADLRRCTRGVDGDEIPRRGTYRAYLALHVPLIGIPAGGAAETVRLMLAADDAGTYLCQNGVSNEWSPGSPEDGLQPTTTYLAAERHGIDNSTGCSPKKRDGDLSQGVVWVVDKNVSVAHVKVSTAGQTTQIIDIAPTDGLVVTWLHATGDSAWRKTTWSVQFLDRAGEPVRIDSHRKSPAPAPLAVSRDLDTCADIVARLNDDADTIDRPTSDEAGVKACRQEIEEYVDANGGAFDADRAVVVKLISKPDAWGAVLADGQRFVACSRFPTTEISAVSQGPQALTAEAFSWAQNSIPGGGESLWAAGNTPGVRSILYRLPDHRLVPAGVTEEGYWMLMASTKTAFGTGEDVSRWEPVQVTATTRDGSRKFSIRWSAKTSCNQVSHGC